MKTVKINSKVAVKTAAPQVQPVNKKTIDKDSKKIKVTKESNLVNASVADLVNNIASGKVENISVNKGDFVDQVATSFKSDSVKQKKQLVSNKASVKKLDTAEKFLGISSERPEIVAVVNFQPIFTDAGVEQKNGKILSNKLFMTDAGHYLNAQLGTKMLNQYVSNDLLVKLMDSYELLNDSIVTQQQKAARVLTESADLIGTLYRYVTYSNEFLNIFDLHDKVHKLEPRSQLSLIAPRISDPLESEFFYDVFTKHITQQFDYVDVLHEFGFASDSVKRFSSTKIWMQLLLEFYEAFNSNTSNLLDYFSFSQTGDVSPSVLVRRTNRFKVNKNPTTLTFEKFADVTSNSVSDVNTKIEQIFNNLYSEFNASSVESRICVLASFLSREFNTSKALANDSVTKTLSEKFGLQTDFSGKGNVKTLQKLFSYEVDDVFTSDTTTKSIASFAKKRINDSLIVCNFESKYIESKSGVFTPASEYYVDSIFDADNVPNLANVKTLQGDSETLYYSYTVLTDAMNMIYPVSLSDSDGAFETFTSRLSEPSRLIKHLTDNIVENFVEKPSISKDVLTPVYSQAKSDKILKNLLFGLSMFKIISNNYLSQTQQGQQSDVLQFNNSYAISIINKINDHLTDTLVKSTSATKDLLDYYNSTFDVSKKKSYNKTDVFSALLNGTGLSKIVEEFLWNIVVSFTDQFCLSENLTNWRAYDKLTLLAAAFDMVLDIVSSCTDVKFVSKATSNAGTTIFSITNNVSNHKSTIDSINNKLQKEASVLIKCNSLISDTLTKIIDKCKAVTAYSESKVVSEKLSRTKEIIGLEQFKLLFNEQQLSLAYSFSQDALSILKNKSNSFNTSTIERIDGESVSSSLVNALYEFCSLQDFSSKDSLNKRILFVGIPIGFTKKLKQKISSNSQLFSERQKDIVYVSVFKIDEERQDLVFKPQKFLFELSRFPSRNSSLVKQIDKNSNLFSYDLLPFRDQVEKDSNVVYKSGMFKDDSYAFLSDFKKEELYKNHFTSLMLETYVKMMSGFSFAEHKFHVKDVDLQEITSEIPKQIVDSYVDLTTSKKSVVEDVANNQVFNSMFSKLQVSVNPDNSKQSKQLPNKSQPKQAISSIDQIAQKSVEDVTFGLTTINNMLKTASGLTDQDKLLQMCLTPRKFDRVLAVVVDSDDFEIDQDKTVASSPKGSSVIEKYIASGDIEPIDHTYKVNGQKFNLDSNVTKAYKVKNRDVTSGDVLFEKYFVTIETTGETV
jgi:hypothetical protein